MRIGIAAAVLMAGTALSACASTGHAPRYATNTPQRSEARGTMRPYQINGVWYTPRMQPDYDETGVASWYGPQFHNRQTADGETFDMNAISAAHTTLPLPSIVEVTNLQNNRTIRVRVNDRGPFVDGRIIDLSRAAAQELGFYEQGTARVRVRYIGPASAGFGDDVRVARNDQERPPPIAANPAYRPVSAVATSGAPLRVQAGAFSTIENAERAAAQLSPAGPPLIEPIERGGRTLFRVTVGESSDPGAIDALRARVAELGFPDARIIGF